MPSCSCRWHSRSYDTSVSWEQHAQIAAQFLELNERIWPWLIITFLVLLLHSMYFMHRIAGPLYRFGTRRFQVPSATGE